MSRLRYDLILFDLDDTLIDFDSAQEGALRDALASVDVGMTPALRARFGAINHGLWQRFDAGELSKDQVFSQRWQDFFGELGRCVDNAAINTLFLDQLVEHSIIADDVRALVEELGADHKLAIVTNGNARTQRLRLACVGLGHLVPVCVVSEDVGFAKPHPAIFRAALAAAGVPQEVHGSRVLMVGDNLHADIGGAAALGFDTCWVSRGKAVSGAHRPTYVVESIGALPKASKQWRKGPMEL